MRSKMLGGLIGLGTLAALTSCVTDAGEASRRLDLVQKQVDRWGNVTAGEVALAADGKAFEVSIDKSADLYVAEAKKGLNGAAAATLERIIENQTRLRAQPLLPQATPRVAAADGATTPTAQGADAATTPTLQPPVLAIAPPSPAPPDLLAAQRATLSSDRFAAPFTLASEPTELTNRAALMQGFNDKMTESLLEAISAPKVEREKRVLFGIVQVSCMPGYLTRKGYAAQVVMNVGYARYANGEIRNTLEEGNATPVVHSVLPLMDAQTLALERADRRQEAIAALLEGAAIVQGVQVNLNNLTNYMRRRQQDTATRNAIPVVTSFTNGCSFGFQIDPQLQALGEPEEFASEPSRVLHPITFPALVTLIVDDRDVKALELEEGGRWDNIYFDVNSRWIDLNPRGWADPSGWFVNERFEEDERLMVARRLDYAMDKFSEADTKNSFQWQEISRRLRMVEALAMGAGRISRYQYHDEFPTPPSVKSIFPSKGWLDRPTTIAIELANVDLTKNPVKAVTVGGIPLCVDEPCGMPGKNVIFCTLDPSALPGETGKGRMEPFADKIFVVLAEGVAASKETVSFDRYRYPSTDMDPGVTIKRDPAGSGLVTDITIKTDGAKDVDAAFLIDRIVRVLESEPCDPACTRLDVVVKPGASCNPPGQ